MHFGKMKMKIKVVAERLTMVESKQEAVQVSITEVKREVLNLKNQFADFVKKRQQSTESASLIVDDKIGEIKVEISEIKKWSSIVQGTGAVGIAGPSSQASDPSRVVKVEVNELFERGKRQNNLVIFGIEETSDEFATRDK